MAKAKKDKTAAAPAAPETQAPAAAPAAEAKPAKEPRPPKIEQNGVTRPGAGTTTARIWDIADGISASIKAPAQRGDGLQTGAVGSDRPSSQARVAG